MLGYQLTSLLGGYWRLPVRASRLKGSLPVWSAESSQRSPLHGLACCYMHSKAVLPQLLPSVWSIKVEDGKESTHSTAHSLPVHVNNDACFQASCAAAGPRNYVRPSAPSTAHITLFLQTHMHIKSHACFTASCAAAGAGVTYGLALKETTPGVGYIALVKSGRLHTEYFTVTAQGVYFRRKVGTSDLLHLMPCLARRPAQRARSGLAVPVTLCRLCSPSAAGVRQHSPQGMVEPRPTKPVQGQYCQQLLDFNFQPGAPMQEYPSIDHMLAEWKLDPTGQEAQKEMGYSAPEAPAAPAGWGAHQLNE